MRDLSEDIQSISQTYIFDFTILQQKLLVVVKSLSWKCYNKTRSDELTTKDKVQRA